MTFEDIVKFVSFASDRVNHPIYGLEAMRDAGYGKQEKTRSATHKETACFSTGVINLIENSCVLCSDSHSLDQCKQFLTMAIEDKQKVIKEHRLCFGCLGQNHISRTCTRKHKCQKCGKLHPSALHIDNFRK